MDPVTQMILLITLLLVLGSLGEYIFSRTGVPDIIWLVAAGIMAGPVFDVVSADMLRPILPFFGAFALVTILSSGGLTLRLGELSDSAPSAAILALISFIFTVLLVALFLKVCALFGIVKSLPFITYLMVGAILGGSSSVVIIPTMMVGKVKSKVADLLNVESSITDALCVVMVLMMIEIILIGHVSVHYPLVLFAKAVGVGIGLGVLGGMLLLPLLHIIYGKTSAYPVILACLLLIYALINLAGGNGALGILAATLLVGNAQWLIKKNKRLEQKLQHVERLGVDRDAMAFHGQVIFLVKSFFFFLIGLMFPSSPKLILIGIAVALLLWAARFPAAWLALRKLDMSKSDRRLITVAMPRGLAAGVLSAMPFALGVPGTENLSGGVFAAIIASILIFAAGFSFFNRKSEAPE